LSVDEAIALRRQADASGRFIAGGTEIVPRMSRGEIKPSCLIELTRLPELRVLETDVCGLRIGAMATHADIQRSPLTKGPYQAMSDASGAIRPQQVINLGSIGGNIAYGMPSADLVPPLLVLNATLLVRGAAGKREMALSEFLVAPYQTRMEDGDVLVEIRVPKLDAAYGSAFNKASKNQNLGIAYASVAAALTLRDGRIHDARIAMGAAAPVPRRITAAEEFLTGKIPDEAVLREAGQLVSAAAKPREDSRRASPYYKRRVLVPLTERAIVSAVERAQGRPMGGKQ
jgi:carbon-monoxide dehydrogenase medium subunit